MLASKQIFGPTMRDDEGQPTMEASASSLSTDEVVTRLRAAVSRMSRAMDREVGSGELTRTQFTVLGTTIRRGPIRLGDLAELENINPTMLSRVVAKLDSAGFIQRKPDPSDQRAALIEATPAGAAAHAEIRAQRTALMARRLAELPLDAEPQLRDALPALELLASAMVHPPMAADPRTTDPRPTDRRPTDRQPAERQAPERQAVR
jgi:DNA-binding MarR family transcriptional regulator